MIVGNVTADGLVEVRGQIVGELQCTSLIVARKAIVKGAVTAERVQVDGCIEGPITGRDVVLKSGAHVIGDIYHETLMIESGAYFDGSSRKANVASLETEKTTPAARWNEMSVPSTEAG